MTARGWVVALALVIIAACSGDDPAGDTAPSDSGPPPVLGVPDELRVDLVEPAIAALEDELSGAQQYFEINVRGPIVNLFVANADATTVTPWAYQDGSLSSVAGSAAQGATFAGDAVEFDAERILSEVRAQLPSATLQALEIIGGPSGSVRYTVVLVGSAGGQILAEVAPDGTIIGVDA
jgi:hypothetical protein